jgi:hypothetical protein
MQGFCKTKSIQIIKAPEAPSERRPADVIGAAIMVARIASGEIENSGRFAGPSRSGFAALQGLLKRHANKALIGNSLFFCPAAHGV